MASFGSKIIHLLAPQGALITTGGQNMRKTQHAKNALEKVGWCFLHHTLKIFTSKKQKEANLLLPEPRIHTRSPDTYNYQVIIT